MDMVLESEKELRPILRQKIDQMAKSALTGLHRALLRVEVAQMAFKITTEFSPQKDFLDGLDQTILEFRKERSYR